ncbi:MAG TPA: hypothetical protein VGH50_01435 [Candidatus Binatia bacterium]
MKGILNDLKQGLALPAAIRSFLAEPLTIAKAEEEVKTRLANRERNFLDFVRAAVYERPESPYRRLLRIAGCELAELESEIHRHGLEPTLAKLAAAGVYLTSSEYKGKRPVVRGGESFYVAPEAFQGSLSTPGYSTVTSGTSGAPMRSFRPVNRYVKAVSTCVFLSAHDLLARAHAMYDGVLPSGGGLSNLLVYAKLGIRTERWFARRVPVGYLEGWKGYLSTRAVVAAARRSPAGFPTPQPIDSGEVSIIVRWLEAKRRSGALCCLTCAVSNAVRVARAAWEMGLSLEGTKFIVGGEPLTQAKNDLIERVGASAVCRFSSGLKANSTSAIGFGCAARQHVDEVHVHRHALAVIPDPAQLDGIGPGRALMITTLHRSSGKFFLNVQNGDYATFEERRCGCDLDRLGLGLHLHHIRSYEKFTSEGMNYFYGDLHDFFESHLPREFGGAPGDYQLVEEEDGGGQTRLTLRVHPGVSGIDEQRLLARLREELGRGQRGNAFQAKIWGEAGTFRISREMPHASPRGKILPLHFVRSRPDQG